MSGFFKAVGLTLLVILGVVGTFAFLSLIFGWLIMLGIGILAASGVVGSTIGFGSAFALGVLYTATLFVGVGAAAGISASS